MKIEHVFLSIAFHITYAQVIRGIRTFGNKSWYSYYFNKNNNNLDFVGPVSDISYYGVD